MEKIWLKNYPPGMPSEVDVQAFSSLRDVLRHSCDRFADLPAYSNIGAKMRYAELDEHSHRVGAPTQ